MFYMHPYVSTAFSAASSPTACTWLYALPRTAGHPEPSQQHTYSWFQGFERLSDLLLNWRKRIAPGCHWSNADGLTAATLRRRARRRAAAGWEALCICALSIVGQLDLFTSSSTLCSCAAAACSRPTDVHSSGTVWSFTKLLMALGPSRGLYSTEP
mmetsp:Transcript_47269/g.94204  ORF Transcript_47269/g.94204 Transcript_47269/m.94204 type:complete len:156 (-) Transcript_47269:95-562(-)